MPTTVSEIILLMNNRYDIDFSRFYLRNKLYTRDLIQVNQFVNFPGTHYEFYVGTNFPRFFQVADMDRS